LEARCPAQILLVEGRPRKLRVILKRDLEEEGFAVTARAPAQTGKGERGQGPPAFLLAGAGDALVIDVGLLP